MINAEDDVIYDLSSSCTVEVAVAKMLGWMQGHIRKRIIIVSENGISEDQLPHLPSLEDSLQGQLMEMREAARQEFIKAAEKYNAGDESFDDLRTKEEAVTKCDDLLNKAASYLRDIEDEISKRESAELLIDHYATDNTGVTHLTLNSIDRWAKAKYGIAIINGSKTQASDQNLATTNDEQIESVIDQKCGLGKTKADHLYTTFAFLVEAFASTASKYKLDERLNIDALAKFLSEQAKSADKDIHGQSSEAIKSRIEDAIKIRKSKIARP